MNNMTDVSEIRKSLSKIHPFSEEQLSLFTDALIYRNLKKKEFLLKENQLSDGITFILTGGFRFFKKMNHSEVTIKFFIENNWIADLESLLTQQPSKNYIEAIEDSEIASIKSCIIFKRCVKAFFLERLTMRKIYSDVTNNAGNTVMR